ncbi:MAG: ATPase, partial [Pseudomonadota bacterium]
MNDVTATEIENLLPQESGEQNWRALHFFNLYRIILAGVFTSLYATQIGPNFFAGYDASLFFSVSVSYLGLAITNSFVIRQHLLPFNSQIFLQGGVDIIAITLLMHASGGIVSGLGMLLVMSIAGCSVLTEGRTAVFFAAMASLAVLIETVVITFSQEVEYNFYPQAGLLGAAFFATAFLSFMLARRIRASDALALQRGAHVEYLSQLNEQIVQHIRTGIIVLDIAGRVQLFNDASKRLLGINGNPENYPLSMVSPELAEQVRNWR